MDQGPVKRVDRRRLTHLDRAGRPRMVDVSAKPVTARRAVAEATIALSAETLSLVIDGGGPKGDVLTVAELAGVMGGKRTSELIPLCHPLPLTDLVVQVTPDRAAGLLRIRAEWKLNAEVWAKAVQRICAGAREIEDANFGWRIGADLCTSVWSRQ